ncbi:MAG: hypothetical protein CM1200mP13_09340 [Candidatus Pelagibacterales bacterium]|nr:MAG: hypothetical protein CM1200mP13_09340 [Pelagibacterales bacterium]
MKIEPFGPLVPMLSFKTFDEVLREQIIMSLVLRVIFVQINGKSTRASK